MPTEVPSDPPRRGVDTPAGRLAYTDEGSGAPAVLAVPGLPGSVRDFRWLAPLIAGHVRMLRLDLPGFGDSPRSAQRGMTTAQRAAAVAALIETLAMPPVTLIAHSSGSTPAAWLAASRPDLVHAIVLLAPTGPRPHYPTLAFQALAAGYRVPPARALLDAGVRRFFDSVGFPRSLTDAERRFSVLDAAALDFTEHRAMLSSVATPSLVCWATDDPVIPSRNVAELVATLPEPATVTFATGGHNIQKTQARPVAEAVLDALATWGSPG